MPGRVPSSWRRFASSLGQNTPLDMHTLSQPVEFIHMAKKSKFIARAKPVTTESLALAVRGDAAARDPKASHHCWAFRLSNGVYRSSDDGEPSGTAGKPIMKALESENVTDCVVVVSRYFGGTLLGTGGLVRAYGNAAKMALQSADYELLIPRTTLRVQLPVEDSMLVYRCMPGGQGSNTSPSPDGTAFKVSERFDNSFGGFETIWRVPCSAVDRVVIALMDASKGRAVVDIVSEPVGV